MVRPARFAACLAVAFLLQACVVHRVSYALLRPDLLYLLAVFVALEAGYRQAVWAALVVGLARDLGSCGRLGGSALILLPAVAGTVLLRERLVRELPWTDLTLTFAFVLGCGLAHAVAAGLWWPSVTVASLVPGAFGQAVFTAALSPLVFGALAGAGIVEEGRGRLVTR